MREDCMSDTKPANPLTVAARAEFDSWSRGYDQNWLQAIFFHPAHNMMLNHMGPDDRRVLDIGCGTGQFAARVLGQFPQTEVWGLDLSAGMLEQAHRRLQNAGERVHLVQGDSENLPFPADSFDVVTCSHSFHHYPNQERVAAEMHRVLAPGGKLMIIDGDRDGLWGWFIFDGIVVLMEGAVKHLSGKAFHDLFDHTGFANIVQERRGGFLPFRMTLGTAVKPAGAGRQAA
jgi:ubiquinone/menaquinone biosynthesis C-methylase UbiE